MAGPENRGSSRLDRLVADAQRNRALRERGYRDRALKILPWICARCAREFTPANVNQLTVHHKDHDHHNNPPDGGNWELLCVYCHDNEHSRELEAAADGGRTQEAGATPGRAPEARATPNQAPEARATYRPLAGLQDLLKRKK